MKKIKNAILLCSFSFFGVLISSGGPYRQQEVKLKQTQYKKNGVLKSDSTVRISKGEPCDLELNSSGEPAGGGQGYTKILSKYTYLARNKKELLLALSKAKSKEIIYVSDSANIDLTGEYNIEINEGIVLSGGRGSDGSKGAHLFSNDTLKNFTLFLVRGEGVHITGLRIEGPDTSRKTEILVKLEKERGSEGYYSIPVTTGIESHFTNTEISDCEISGWSHSAISLYSGRDGKINNNFVHHNYIHHNQRYGLGYGISLDKTFALIEGNLFDWNRHSIQGSGNKGTSYEARYNLVFGNSNSHPFDMHGGSDRSDGTEIAGTNIFIHHNTFHVFEKTQIIVIRGKPEKECVVSDNLFFNADSAKCIVQMHVTGNMKIFNNFFCKE